MDVLYYFVDLLANFDEHLTFWCANYGAWTIAILALIVFAETGLVVFPFLPGDSMLFIVGVFCGAGLLDYHAVVPALIVAAVLGDALNFTIGQRFGGALIRRSRHIAAGHAQSRLYFAKHGARTIVIARFVPVVRTQTTPVFPLEFCFSPMTSEVAASVSPGAAGWWNRPSA